MVTNHDRNSFGKRIAVKISKSSSDHWRCWRFSSVFRHFRTYFMGSFHMSKSSAHVRCPVAQLLILSKSAGLQRLAREFDNNLWGGHCFGLSRTRHNWAAQFLTAASDGACSRNVSVKMAWISFGALPCRRKTWKFTSRCWNHAGHLTCFLSASVQGTTRTHNKKRLAIWHMNRPFFPTTLSIPPYDIRK